MRKMKKFRHLVFASLLVLQGLLLALPFQSVTAAADETVYVYRRDYNTDIGTTNNNYVGLNGVTFTIYDISDYYKDSGKSDEALAKELASLEDAAVKKKTGVTTKYKTVVTKTMTTEKYGERAGVAEASLAGSDTGDKAYLFVETEAPVGAKGRCSNVLVVLKEKHLLTENSFFPKIYIPTTPGTPSTTTTTSSSTSTSTSTSKTTTTGSETDETTGTTTSTDSDTNNTHNSSDTTPSNSDHNGGAGGGSSDFNGNDNIDGDGDSNSSRGRLPSTGLLGGKLPTTGEMISYTLTILGIGLILVAIVLKKLHKKEN